jgi:hypothetical protein
VDGRPTVTARCPARTALYPAGASSGVAARLVMPDGMTGHHRMALVPDVAADTVAEQRSRFALLRR